MEFCAISSPIRKLKIKPTKNTKNKGNVNRKKKINSNPKIPIITIQIGQRNDSDFRGFIESVIERQRTRRENERIRAEIIGLINDIERLREERRERRERRERDEKELNRLRNELRMWKFAALVLFIGFLGLVPALMSFVDRVARKIRVNF